MKRYAVYILTNKSRTLYTGVTSDLAKRLTQHKNKEVEGFTKRYRIDALVYCEFYQSVYDAISREKEIKGWIRKKKVALIEEHNPEWQDLSEFL